MGPFSATTLLQPCRQMLLAATLLSAPFLLGACEDEQDKAEQPTEPWRKDEVEREANNAASRVRYRVEPGALLSVSLKTRKSNPIGQFDEISGYVDFDLRDLSKSRGRIQVELDSLSMQNLSPEILTDDDDIDSGLKVLVTDASGEALRWLGLGAEVDAEAKHDGKAAVFEFESLRALSHTSARAGARRKKDSAGERRQVYATANGELAMRGLSVGRRLATTLHFDYPEEAQRDALPERVTVTLRRSMSVPLAEYDIVPRGPKGNEVVMKRDWLGRWIGTSAKISGSVSLEKVGAPPK